MASGETVSQPPRTTQSASSFPFFEFAEYLPLHYMARASKVTPSGRLRSCVLMVLADGVVLCSNRGGVHRFVSLAAISKIRMFSRGRILILVRNEHNLMLVCSPSQEAVGVVVRVAASMTGSTIPVDETDDPPPVETLQLRPLNSFVSKVPVAFSSAIREARKRLAASKAEQATKALGTSVGASPAREACAKFFPSTPATVPDPSPLASSIPPSDIRKGAENDEGAQLVILGCTFETIQVTVPATLSLWWYLMFVSRKLPGAQQPPCITVRCAMSTMDNCAVCSISQELFLQTMKVYTERVKHTATVQSRTTIGVAGAARNVDATLFWMNPFKTAW